MRWRDTGLAALMMSIVWVIKLLKTLCSSHNFALTIENLFFDFTIAMIFKEAFNNLGGRFFNDFVEAGF